MSSRCSPPIISHSFSLAFQLFSELPPRCGLPIVFQLYPLALNLKASLLLGCKAGLLVSGYWCLTLWISLVRVLVSGFPFICLPSASMVSRFPRASLHWSLCLLVSQPGFGRQVVSVSPDVSLHLNGFICFPLWLVVSAFWVVLSGSPGVCLYLSSFMCLPFWLVVSAVRMSSLCFHLAAIIFPYHLSPDSSVSQLMCLQSSVCLTVVVSDSFLVSHNLFPTSFVSPFIVSPGGAVLFLFHRDFICDWPLSLFISPIVSCCCLSSCTSTDPR